MPSQNGRDLLLMIGNGGSPETFTALGAVRVIDINISNSPENATALDGTGAEVTQLNLNDGTVEGIRINGADASSIQYHPEAAPGPWDSRPYFFDFVEKMGRAKS
jgi:carbamoyl-phosphate synthase small subunit